MRSIIVFLAVLFGFTLVTTTSCSSGKGNKVISEDEKPVDNDSIQSVFFNTPFGSSKDDVIKNFTEHDLMCQKYVSTDEGLHFVSKSGRYFSFGGMNWEMCNVILCNNKFSGIRFYNASNDKAEALKSYEQLHSTVSGKYNLNDVEVSDTTIYAWSTGICEKQNRIINVSCYRYETITKDIMIGVELSYYDKNYVSVSDEL